jgi:exodeoxyribonuclease VII large subunit
MNEQDESIRTIRKTNAFIKSVIEAQALDIGHFWIGGEITHHHKSDRNHVYFTLTDEGFSISCMVYNNDLENIDFPLSKGIVVDAYGKLTVYDKQARIEFQVERMRLVDKQGVQFETDVIKRLKDKGLYPRQEKDILSSIKRIALITSKSSAAVEDFRNTYYREGGTAQIDILDVLLQGELAAPSIAGAIQRANQQKDVDVIVLTRGGGRQIDLAVFNDYLIAEAICLSKLPVVTGIGHHEDDTIADRVADVYCITPTAAAIELAKLSKFAYPVQVETSVTPSKEYAARTEIPIENKASISLSPAIILVGIPIIILLTILVIRSF